MLLLLLPPLDKDVVCAKSLRDTRFLPGRKHFLVVHVPARLGNHSTVVDAEAHVRGKESSAPLLTHDTYHLLQP